MLSFCIRTVLPCVSSAASDSGLPRLLKLTGRSAGYIQELAKPTLSPSSSVRQFEDIVPQRKQLALFNLVHSYLLQPGELRFVTAGTNQPRSSKPDDKIRLTLLNAGQPPALRWPPVSCSQLDHPAPHPSSTSSWVYSHSQPRTGCRTMPSLPTLVPRRKSFAEARISVSGRQR